VLTIQEAKTRKYGHNGTNVGKNSLLSMRKVIGLMTHQIKTAKESGASEKQKYENKSENELTLYLQSVHEELLWAQKEIDKATKSSYKPNSKDVTKMLENVNSIRDQERNLEKQIESPKNNPKIIKQVRSGAIEELNRIYKNIPASNFSADETINQKFSDKYIKEILSSLTMGMAIISPLLCFGIITQMHENICRYPEKNRSPLIEYSKNHVLIEYFPQIIQNTTFCLEEMNKYFELEIFQLKEMNEQ